MILYDTFSVNVSMKNPKESKTQSTGIAASRKSKESSILTSREASCSSDHIDNIPIEKQCFNKFFRSLKNENFSINDKSTCAKYIVHGQDDVKENLDPIKSRMLSHRSTLDSVNLTNNIDDTTTMSNSLCGENDNERLVSSDTNLSVSNRTICNTNIDNVMDGVTLVSNSCNQGLRINLESVQQPKLSAPAEERPGARLFCKTTNRITYNADFDLNVNMNKNVEKLSQDNITALTNQHIDGDRIGNDHIDDSPTLWNDCKPLDNINIMRSKINNRNIVSNITRFNEHDIQNKQIDACNSRKFIRYIAFQENTIRRNGETRAKNNEFCLKVSINLCRIQKLIDSKPELFKNREYDANDQRREHTKPNLDEYIQQQVKYVESSNINLSNHLPTKKLQKSTYTYNVEHLQQDSFLDANISLQYRKSNQIKNVDKDVLDR